MTEKNRQMVSFFGAITASLSHEMKNSLATINEYSGLLDDLVQASSSDRPLKPERLEKVCQRISKQVRRSEELIARLNRFAHFTDEPQATIALTELLELFCNLCNRFAKLAQVKLERSFVEPSPTLMVDPFAVLDALHICLRATLDAAAPGDTVTVSSRSNDTGCEVSIAGQQAIGPLAPDRQQLLESLLQDRGGTLRWTAEQRQIDVTFTSAPIAGTIVANTQESRK